MPLIPWLLSPLASTEASAVIYLGNPELEFHVDRPAQDYLEGSVGLDKVRVHHCAGGSTDYEVDATIDPVLGTTVAIGAGNHCSIELSWTTVMDIDGDGSLGAFTVRYDKTETTIPLASTIDPVALTPYSVVSGSMSGGSPWLVANIE